MLGKENSKTQKDSFLLAQRLFDLLVNNESLDNEFQLRYIKTIVASENSFVNSHVGRIQARVLRSVLSLSTPEFDNLARTWNR